jgi:hypothetical protein
VLFVTGRHWRKFVAIAAEVRTHCGGSSDALRRKFRGALGEGLDLGGVSVQGESAMVARRREEGSPSPVYGKTHLELVRGKVDLDLVCAFMDYN